MAGFQSLQLVAIRATRLNADSSPMSGADNGYVTRSLITAQIQPDYQNGAEIQVDNGAGGICAYYKGPDVLKKLNVNFDLCSLDMEMIELLTTQSTITSGGEVIGNYFLRSGACSTVDNNGVALEFWTKRWESCGQPSDSLLYWHWILPYAILRTGDYQFDNNFLKVPVTGYAQENLNWGAGPYGDFPAVSLDSVGAVFADSSIPETEGYITVP